MTTETPAYDELYMLLVHLCEQAPCLADEALLNVMEAFNGLVELHAPHVLPSLQATDPVNQLGRALELLDGLVQGSPDLTRTLQLTHVRRLVGTAMDAHR
jgi:hypothetical protein